MPSFYRTEGSAFPLLVAIHLDWQTQALALLATEEATGKSPVHDAKYIHQQPTFEPQRNLQQGVYR